ncbi:MAG: TIR domain-containing protein, partial [Ilumatobacteraceae bacterium]
MERGRGSYAAFISYRRDADSTVAQALQQGLQRFAKPWYRARALRVFRDDSSLSANPGLWPAIQAALDESDFLVLLASTKSADSEWVGREVGHWLGGHPASNLLIAITEGNIAWDGHRGDFDWTRTTAVPRELGARFTNEPRYVDLRWARSSERLSLDVPAFSQAVADLAAPMHGRPKDELIGEDVAQHRRTVRLARAGVATLAALALLAGLAGVIALRQRDDARSQRDRAEAQERLAVSRQLAAQALVDLPEQPDRALLLSLESLASQSGPHGLDALLTSLQHVSAARAYLDNDVPVHSLAYSPDGTLLATGHNDGTIRLWDVDGRRQLGDPLDGHQLLVETMAFSPDGDVLAAVDRDGAVVLRDTTTRLRQGPTFGTSVLSVVFSPDGARLVTGDTGGEVQEWNVATGRPVGPPLIAPGGRIYRMTVSPDGLTLAVTTTNGEVTLWDLA